MRSPSVRISLGLLLALACGRTDIYPEGGNNLGEGNSAAQAGVLQDAGSIGSSACCTPDASISPDAGRAVRDAGVSPEDSGESVFDAGPSDAGRPDAGSSDAGPFDAGHFDGGLNAGDGGAGFDAGAFDAGWQLSCDAGYVWTVLGQGTFSSSIAGLGPDDVWVAEGQGVSHWDGQTWTSPPNSPEARYIWEVAPDQVWAASGNWLVWDGGSWASAWATPGMPVAFWSSDPQHLFATDWNGNIAQNNGGGWVTTYWGPTQQAGGYAVTYPLYGLSGSGPDDVWAVGDFGYAVHSSGAGMRVYQLPTRQFLSVAVLAPNDAWAVGIWGGVFHWNGSSWEDHTDHTDAGGQNDYARAWGNSPANVWLTSDRNIRHWDGQAWTDEGPMTDLVTALWGTGCQVWVGLQGGQVMVGNPP